MAIDNYSPKGPPLCLESGLRWPPFSIQRTVSLAPSVGDALIATARGDKQDEADRAALAKLRTVEQARHRFLAK
jgi:hypothetical protein